MTGLKIIPRLTVLAALVALSACGKPVAPDYVNDPNEAQNRRVHEFNKSVDRKVLRPMASTYGSTVPSVPARAVNNFATNFSEPRNVVNSLLQLRLKRAADASLRFIVNTTLGIGGLIDMAEKAGVPTQSTDFGETLYVWGLGEGAYMELPLLGPSTSRHAVGRVVDLFLNPLTYVLPEPEAYYGTAASFAGALDARDQMSGTMDDILDNSADSYTQARILYLQSRRHMLSGGQEEAFIDPFEELGLE